MPFDIGINFRSTSGYVTDGANETYCLADIYPVTRGGVTFGWLNSSVDTRDRNSANDRRLAGINFATSTGNYFRLDLPSAGSYDIHLAGGDAAGSGFVDWDVKDGTTLLFSVVGPGAFGATSGAQKFVDATGAEYSDTTWAGSETKMTVTLAGTELRVQDSISGANDVIAHLRVVAAGGGTPAGANAMHVYREHVMRGGG